MKTYLKTLGCAFFLGLIFFGLGPILFEEYGFTAAALFAALVLIPGWFICHQYAWISNPPGSLWVDMGWAIVAANLAWAWCRYGVSPAGVIPTLLLCGVGIVSGVVVANVVKACIGRHGKDSSQLEKEST